VRGNETKREEETGSRNLEILTLRKRTNNNSNHVDKNRSPGAIYCVVSVLNVVAFFQRSLLLIYIFRARDVNTHPQQQQDHDGDRTATAQKSVVNVRFQVDGMDEAPFNVRVVRATSKNIPSPV
jgi:hypothetical protein